MSRRPVGAPVSPVGIRSRPVPKDERPAGDEAGGTASVR